MTEMVTVGELMVARAGSVTPANFPDEEFDLYSIPAHDRGSPEITVGRAIGSAKQIVRPGDVLLSKIVPHIRRAWVVGPNRGHRMIASGEWIVFRDERLHTRYLRHVLLGDPFHVQFMNTVAGVGGSLLRARPAFVARIQIPLPPLDEQRRIAWILDQADALRTKRREALAHLDDLTQSIFLDMFGDLDVGESRTVSLGEVSRIASGITKGRKLGDVATTSVPYLAVSNVQDGSLNMHVVKEIEATTAEIERYRLQEDDLVLTEGGDPDKLGRGTVWNNELPLCIHQNHIFRVRIADSEQLHPAYLNQYMSGRAARAYFLRSAKQTTGIASINMTQLRGLPVVVPPLQRQLEFAVAAEAACRQVSLAKDHARTLDSLSVSLQSRAFAGEL